MLDMDALGCHHSPTTRRGQCSSETVLHKHPGCVCASRMAPHGLSQAMRSSHQLQVPVAAAVALRLPLLMHS